MRKLLLVALVLLFVQLTFAGQDENFEPSGKVTARIYSNYNASLSEPDRNSVFEIQRAYFGYDYQMSPNFSARVMIDIGSPDESVYSMVKRYAYIRNAYVKYKRNNFDIKMGIFSMNHFKVQEDFWGFRYLYKSFADEHKFGNSVDLGIIAHYKFSDRVSGDMAIINGEGYSQLQNDSNYEYTAGITLKAPQNLTWRVFTNYGPSADLPKIVSAFFIGYQAGADFSIAAEYNFLKNNQYRENRNQQGYSFYAKYSPAKNWKVFGRYDILNSNILENTSSPWNLSKDGTAIIAGVEKKLNPNLKVSLNYQDWYSRAANLGDSSYLYFNVEFKL